MCMNIMLFLQLIQLILKTIYLSILLKFQIVNDNCDLICFCRMKIS